MEQKIYSHQDLNKVLTTTAWKELSETFSWSEQLLENNKENIDWRLLSENNNIFWTPAIVERFKGHLDWNTLSAKGPDNILNRVYLSLFKEYWNWDALSGNTDLILTYELIDEFIDLWNWEKLIDRYEEPIYSFEFLQRYFNKIPVDNLCQFSHTRLWHTLVEIRKNELLIHIIS